ncbi:MAG: hypothetical protein IT384_18905 [Deltaproteobacteria bacterium]|nr:hypothetical protein [Deltaproteobacteria bacterium]
MDELETLIAGDSIGAGVSADDLALARALVNSGIAGEVDIVGEDDALSDVGAEIDIIGAEPPRPAPTPPRKTVTASQLRSAVNNQAMRLASQLMPGAQALGAIPRAVEKKLEGAATETAYLAMFRDASNGGLIAAGVDVDIIGEPQKPFRPESLVIDDDSARDFLILDIKIGTDSLFVNSGPIPASQFTGDAILNALRTRTGQTSQQIIIRVRNRSPGARPFYASFKGSKLK